MPRAHRAVLRRRVRRAADRMACACRSGRQPRRDDARADRRRRHDTVARARHAAVARAVERADRAERGARTPASQHADRLSRQERDERRHRRGTGQPLPAGRQLPRLYRVAGRRHAAGSVGVRRRRAHQRIVRRRRELGHPAAVRDRHAAADSRLEPDLRAQHARWRARDHDEERQHEPGRCRGGRRGFVGTQDGAVRAGRPCRRSCRLLPERERGERQRLGRPQCEPRAANLRQAALYRCRYDAVAVRRRRGQCAAGHADDSALVPRQSAAGLYLSGPEPQSRRLSDAVRRSCVRRSRAAERQPVLPPVSEHERQQQRERRRRPRGRR
ncbi:hypothetical protein FEP69_05290 [Burkholderia multivorans]|nr:hypothetical protein [Burkholderia multivorans]